MGDRPYIESESSKSINNDPNIRSRLIFQTKLALFKESGDIKVEYYNGKRGTNPDITCIRSSAILPQMRTKMPINDKAVKDN